MNKKHPSLIKLGNRIRELRKDRGFSQEAFAAEVGLDRTYMGSIERIAKCLKVEVGELFPAIEKLHVD
jgi:DNA-binding XRE family transcriptional regulator